MKVQFVPIDYDYFDFEGKNFIRLIGRNEKGKRICVVDNYEANLWAVLKEGLSEKKTVDLIKKIEKIKIDENGRETKVLKVEKHDKKYLGKDVKALKVFVTNHKDAHGIADKLGMKEVVARRGYDISMLSKYIIEKKVEPLKWYEVEGEILAGRDFGGLSDNLEVDLCIHAESFKLMNNKEKEKELFVPRILAYDIECDEFELGKGNVLMISLYGNDGNGGKVFKKVLTWKKCSIKQDFVECFKSEEEMIEKFIEYVKSFSPDFLVGYFSDGFDLPYLRAVAEKNKIKLDLGLDGTQPRFSRGRIPSGRISGIVHVDLFRFIQSVYSQYLQSETLGLNDVAFELIGEKKHDFDFKKLSGKMNEGEWKDFFEYNLHDSELTFKLAEKIWPDIFEFTQIIREPVYEVTRSAMSSHVEDYLLHNLDRFNEIPERRPGHDEIGKRRGMGKYEGAFVFQPTPGLYENIVMFDFTSMYASVIVSYNLSLSTLESESPGEQAKKGKKTAVIEFSKKRGFFPTMLEEIITLRKKYKEEYKKDKNPMKKATSNAYKLLANASYGYQGFFGARYYCREAAAATASFAKKNILEVMEKIKKKGYEIIYSDTDSIAFLRGKSSKKDVLEFLEDLNKNLPGIMELDLEDFYSRALFVSKRTTDAGAKKKYALIDENGKLKIRGFETVRRDWCTLARKLQSDVLGKILKDGNEKSALKIVKETIKKLKDREIKIDDLIIRTQLKKPLNEYLSEGPHVIAAKKMLEQDLPVSQGMLVEYYIAESNGNGKAKTKRIGDKVKLPDEKGEYEIDYYLNNQLLPAVENILEVFGININEIIEGHTQKKLF